MENLFVKSCEIENWIGFHLIVCGCGIMTSEEESQRRNCKDYKLDEIWSHEYQRVQCIEWITNNKYKNVRKKKSNQIMGGN